MNLQRKVNLTVRLFLCLFFAAGQLGAEDERIPKRWIEEARKNRIYNGTPHIPEYEKELVSRIYKHILSKQGEAKRKEHQNYKSEIPETGVPYEMVAIKGGSFLLGSPEDEKDRQLNEGPQREIELSDFWIGKFEVTWDQFLPYSERTPSAIYDRDGIPRNPETLEELVHWVSAPTQPYMRMDFEMGLHGGFPAVNMSHHSATKFCQWLSLQTGHFYRLPTEAEWEYACRAGTTGAFHCAPEKIEAYAVIDPEQVRTGYEKVGQRKPNPWGLFDMHGNVLEWCLDAYLPGYAHLSRKDPYNRPEQRFSRVFRGGSWYDTAEYCRSSRRDCSTPNLLAQDPQLPKSLWHLTDASWLGFRIARPSKLPSEEEMYQIWNCGAMYHKEGDKIFELDR